MCRDGGARAARSEAMPPVAHIFGFALAVTAIGAWYDWRTGHIPNWLTLGALGVAIVAHGGYAFATVSPSAASASAASASAASASAASSARAAFEAAGLSLLGAAICALIPLLLYRMDAIGGGDVKLLAALGAILRPMLGIEAELYGFLAAAIIAPAWLAYEGKLGAVLANTLAIVKNPFLPKTKRREIPPEMLTSIRFGPGVFVGTCGAAAMHWSSL
jgi:prepilin peptidase CpaA